jgi:methylated-DNA-[protein]-cysteine S-methyltransferase
MSLNLLEYDLSLPGRLERLSTEFPAVEWEARPLGRKWLVRCEGAVEDLRALPGHPNIAALSLQGERHTASFLYGPSRTERRILEDAARWDAMVLPPLRWKDGRVTVQLVAHQDAPPSWWRDQHKGARLLQKHRTEPHDLLDRLDRPAGMAPALTHRQSEVLLEAVRLGYYELPRRSTVRDIAQRLHLARSTAEEHLRAAESAMIRSTAPLVAARQRAESLSHTPADAGSFELFARFSAELELYVQMSIRDERIYEVSFRRTRPEGVRKGTHPYLQRVLHHIATGTDGLEDLPVELGVGPFSRRVLEEVRHIPPGVTRTYGEIAKRIGEPGAARAVGNALAENPVVVVVPCHRVVPSKGGVGQYSGEGGPETKRRLLRTEGAMTDVGRR